MKTNLREVATASDIVGADHGAFSHHNWGYVFALLGTVFFSMKSIFVKLVYQPVDGMEMNGVEAITIMAMRLGFSAPFYVAIFWLALRNRTARGLAPLQKRDMALAAITGVLGYYICAWLDIEGIKYITAQLERLLLFTYPIFVFIFGALFFGKPLTKGTVLAVLIAYAGIGLIFLGGDIAVGINVPLGSAMILLCAALFAFFQLFAKPMIARLGSPVFTCCAMLGAGVVIFAHFVTENVVMGDVSEVLNLPPRIWGLGIALAFFSTLLPSFMVNLAISRVGPQATSAVGMIARLGSPVFTCCAMLGAGVVIFAHFVTENVVMGDVSDVLNLPSRIWVLGIALAFFSTLLPTFMVNLAISRVGPQATSAVGMIAPISTIVLAIFVLGEPFGFIDGVGTLITVAGIGLYTYFDRRAITAPLSSLRQDSGRATDK